MSRELSSVLQLNNGQLKVGIRIRSATYCNENHIDIAVLDS